MHCSLLQHEGLIAWPDSWVKFPSTGGACMFSECTHPACLSSERPLGSPDSCRYVPPFHFQRFGSNISWHSTSVRVNCSTRIDFSLEQIIKQSRRSEIIAHESFVAQSLNSSNKLQHRSVRCCYLRCGMSSLFA